MSIFPNLLSPLALGPLNLSNRVAMAPLTRGRADSNHVPTALMAEYYAKRASAGLIISEGAHISVRGRGWYRAPDVNRQEDVAAWRPITAAVHSQGGHIVCQLWHTGRASHSSFRAGRPGFPGENALGVAPSAIARRSESGTQRYSALPGDVPVETPRALTTEEVRALPEEFRHAANIAKLAGFDGVELHAASGFLLDEFLQSCSNERTDEFGGSLENRFRVVELVLRAVLEVWDAGRVGIRISPHGTYNGMGSVDNTEAFLYYARRLSEFGLGFMHVVIGTDFGGFHGFGKLMTMKDFRAVYKGVLIANMGYNAEKAEKEISDGDTDMVSFGRYFVANPDLVERFAKGADLAEADFKDFFSEAGNDLGAEGYTTYKAMEC